MDDVATSGPGDSTVEQTKSGLAHNPVADRSIELWKTLHNWIEAVRAGALGQGTRFVLYVAQPHSGPVVRALHDAKSRQEALSVIRQLRDDFWGVEPARAERANLPVELARHVNAVLSASDEVLVQLFAGFSLESGSGVPNDDLLPLIRQKALSDKSLEDVLIYLLGWVKRATEKAIAAGKPAILRWEDFQVALVGAAKKFDRSASVLTPTPVAPTSEEIERELRERLYVTQLVLVSCAEPELVRAVNDFLRASVDRTTWSERGDVLEDSFADFEDRLCRGWDSHRKRVHIAFAGRQETELGQLLLASCMELLAPLQGMDVPSYFVPGSFHSLADQLAVGWHPRFKDLVSGEGGKTASARETDEAEEGGKE